MTTFKDIIKKDVTNIFFNFDEFGEKHTVDGNTRTVIVEG